MSSRRYHIYIAQTSRFSFEYKSENMSSSTTIIPDEYESSMNQLRSLLPNNDSKSMSDYDVVRSATDYIQTLIQDSNQGKS